MLSGNADAQTFRNRYSFTNAAGPAPDGTAVIDSVGGMNGVVRVLTGGMPGVDGTWTATPAEMGGPGLLLPGGSHAAGGAYVDLPNGMISSITGNASFEAWYTITVNDATTDWARIWDFGDSGDGTMETTLAGVMPPGTAGDTFFYAPKQANTNSGAQRVAIENSNAQGPVMGDNGGGQISFDPIVASPTGSLQHVLVSYIDDFDGGGPNTTAGFRVYRNGVFIGQSVDAPGGTELSLDRLNDINNWLGKSNYNGDDQFGGILHEFRIWNGAMDESDSGTNFILGPDRTGDLLILVVNISTGDVKIINTQDVAFDIDYYKISSAAGALNVGAWNSLDDQEGGDPLGEGWDEGNSDANKLQEFVLDPGGVQFEADGVVSLGNIYNTSMIGDPDLVLEYGGPSGYLIQAPAVFEICGLCGLPGDYNLDSMVNAADYTVYRNCLSGINGCTSLPPETDDTPGVGYDDFLRWKNLYGTEVGAGDGGSLNGGNVPEPSTFVAALIGLAAATLSCLRRRAKLVFEGVREL
jgi:hypothetical protein